MFGIASIFSLVLCHAMKFVKQASSAAAVVIVVAGAEAIINEEQCSLFH